MIYFIIFETSVLVQEGGACVKSHKDSQWCDPEAGRCTRQQPGATPKSSVSKPQLHCNCLVDSPSLLWDGRGVEGGSLWASRVGAMGPGGHTATRHLGHRRSWVRKDNASSAYSKVRLVEIVSSKNDNGVLYGRIGRLSSQNSSSFSTPLYLDSQ